MKSQALAVLTQLQKSILETPSDLNNWRLLYREYSSENDKKAAVLAEVVSRISRADIEVGSHMAMANATSGEAPPASYNHAVSHQLVDSYLDDHHLELDLGRAHKLVDAGAFQESKKILLRLSKAKQEHIKAWALYLLAKCLYDQHQLTSSLFLCQQIIQKRLAPRDLVDRAEELLLTINDGITYQIEICADHIKPSFYCKQLLKIRPQSADLPTSNDECYHHYQRYGSKIGINPTPWFNTRTYLDNNPDVSHSGCCPFFHYLAAGKKEGRIGTEHGLRFASYVRNQIGLPKDLYEESLSWLKPTERDNYLSKVELSNSLQNPIVLSISHDCYYESPGGIQLCIHREQQCFQEKSINYIHVFPRQPSPMPLHSKNPQAEVVVSQNGVKLGVTSLFDLSEVLSRRELKLVFIHSLLGISPQDVTDLICKQNSSTKVLYWMHDYSALCSSYQLLRNKVSFCGAPPLGSAQCNYCFYGNSRAGNVDNIIPLLKHNQTELVFPSHAALSAWQSGAKTLCLEFDSREHVINHIRLLKSESVNRAFDNRLPRIAFLGHPTYAKGWDSFSSLIRDPDVFNNFDWYHLGATSDDLSSDIEYVYVNISDSPDAMIRAIRETKIDFALIWPQWPETFCLTAYEAVIGEANIITNEDSGNVAAFARSIPYGHVIQKNHTALKAFLLQLTPHNSASLTFPYEVQYEYSQMSAEVLS